jgi:hypothetical protein
MPIRAIVALIMLLGLARTTIADASTQVGLTTDQQRAVLREGHDAYTNGLRLRTTDPSQAVTAFERAIDRYSVLIDDGLANGPLLYDLGNAKVQAGQIGPAIATYLRASRLMPGDARLAENLAHARAQVRTHVRAGGSEAVLDRMLFWHRDWSPTAKLVLFGLSWCALWGLLLVRCWRRIPGFRTSVAGAAVLSAALGASVLWPVLVGASPIGVLVQDNVIVRKGDSEAFEQRFEEPIHQGVEFRVLESRPQWLHIELPDGQDGWVPRDAAQVVGAHRPQAITTLAGRRAETHSS